LLRHKHLLKRGERSILRTESTLRKYQNATERRRSWLS
jgi:hypothetical protein